MKQSTLIAFSGCLWKLFLCAPLAAAEPKQLATITKFFGKASLLSPVSATTPKDQARVIFEGTSYAIEAAKIGAKLFDGGVIQTGEKTMVRLVFDNGDQVMVSAQSSYKLSTEKKAGGEDKPVSDLLYGKFRAVISKEGPRNNMEVRTRTMVMGIRGTDFHVSAADDSGASVLAVLRGVVAVSQKPAAHEEASKPVEVGSGFSARIPAPAAPAADAAVEQKPKEMTIKVNQTDKLDLKQIQEAVSFKTLPAEARAEAPIDPQLQATLAKLEEQAVVSTKSDIKSGDPALYERIEAAEKAGKKIENLDNLQDVTVEKALLRAPEPSPEKQDQFEEKSGIKKSEAPAPKPSSKELEKMEGDVYDKYFKQ